MRGDDHLLVAVATSVAVCHTPVEAILLYTGSLLPDIDMKRSLISCYFPGVSKQVRLLTKHRDFTHTIWFALLFVWCPYLFVGIILHLFCDSFGKKPLNIFSFDILQMRGKAHELLRHKPHTR